MLGCLLGEGSTKGRELQWHDSLRKPGKYISKHLHHGGRWGALAYHHPFKKTTWGASVPHILSLHRHESHMDPWMESGQLYTTDPSEALQAAPLQSWPEAAWTLSLELPSKW